MSPKKGQKQRINLEELQSAVKARLIRVKQRKFATTVLGLSIKSSKQSDDDPYSMSEKELNIIEKVFKDLTDAEKNTLFGNKNNLFKVPIE